MEKEKCELCGGDGIIEEMGDGENFEYDVIAEHPCPNCKKITDHEFQNPCFCGCDGNDQLCGHYDEDCNQCLKPKKDHLK